MTGTGKRRAAGVEAQFQGSFTKFKPDVLNGELLTQDW